MLSCLCVLVYVYCADVNISSDFQPFYWLQHLNSTYILSYNILLHCNWKYNMDQIDNAILVYCHGQHFDINYNLQIKNWSDQLTAFPWPSNIRTNIFKNGPNIVLYVIVSATLPSLNPVLTGYYMFSAYLIVSNPHLFLSR